MNAQPRRQRLIRILVCCVVACHGAIAWAAETIEQDRRVEEQKRHELRPADTTPLTRTTAPALPGQAQPPAPIGALPIYFLEVSQRYVTYHYDAAKAMVVLAGKDDEYLNLESQVRYMREAGLLPRRYHDAFEPTAPLRKGLLAVLLCRSLQIRGGITRHLLPGSERYAMKELVHEGILSSGYTHDLVSGQEFVATLSRAGLPGTK